MSDYGIRRGKGGRVWVSRDGQPLDWPAGAPQPLNGFLYERISNLSGNLEDKSNLSPYHQAQAVLGTVTHKHLFLQFRALASEFEDPWTSAKDEVKDLLYQARKLGGEDRAAGIGTGFHRFADLSDKGVDIEYPINGLEPWLACYRAAMDSRFTVLASEGFVVVDDLDFPGSPEDIRAAGSFDRVLLDNETGEVLVADVKGLSLDTKLPTPTGWTTMGAVQVGDQVFGADGNPCSVVMKSDVKRIGTYVVTFDDGSKVVCDREHIWETSTYLDRTSLNATRRSRAAKPRSIAEVIATLIYKGNGQRQHCVKVAESLRLPDVELPIEPYLLGCWLGDGQHDRGVITKQDDLFEILKSDGVTVGKSYRQKPSTVAYCVIGLITKLKSAGLAGNKHIPDVYLRSSIGQRTRLLQGLMDTDGTWNTARDRATFTSTGKALALAVEELLLTLGQKPHFASVQCSGFGKTVTAYHVEFTPRDLMPFRLPRKAAKVVISPRSRASRRIIWSVEPGPDVETACIAVDSPDHLYLCTERMVPTHNTGRSDPDFAMSPTIQVAAYAHGVLYDQATGQRSPIHPAISLTRGALIHVPVNGGGEPECIIYPLDLQRGWQLAMHAADAVEGKKIKCYKRDALARSKGK